MAREDFRFSFPKRVRMSEVDAAAIVFNARYLDYLDIALSEYRRAVHGEASFGALYPFARTTIEYRKSARFDDLIDLCLRCSRIGRSSLTFTYEFHGAGEEDLRCVGESVAVHFDGGRTAPVPDELAALLEAYEGRSLRG